MILIVVNNADGLHLIYVFFQGAIKPTFIEKKKNLRFCPLKELMLFAVQFEIQRVKAAVLTNDTSKMPNN